MQYPDRRWCGASLRRAFGLVLAAGTAAFAFALPPQFTALRLSSPHVTNYEFFGRGVASLGAQLVVGAPGSSIPSFGLLPGRVYVLGLDGTVGLVIENPTPAPGDEFGAAVAVVGGNIAVGAPFDDTVATDAGAAYLFDGATGALLQTLLVPGSGINSQCGRAIATLGGDVLVMCDGVYRFDGGTGALVRHFTAPGCLGGRGLATIAGDVLSAGYGGTICRFDGATGAVVQTYVDPEPGLGGSFGSSIGVDGNVVVVGGDVLQRDARVDVRLRRHDGCPPADASAGPYYGTPYNAGFGTSVAAAGGVLVGSGWNSARFYDGVSYAFLGEWQPEDFRRDASRDTVTPVFGTSFALWTDTIHPNVGRGSVTLLDRCGNGVLSPAEQCDDGNTTSGDGCSATCRLELCPTTFPVACHSIDPGGSSTVSLRKRTRAPGAERRPVRVEVEGRLAAGRLRRSDRWHDLSALLLRRPLRDARSPPLLCSPRRGALCWCAVLAVERDDRLRLQGSRSHAQRNRQRCDPGEGRSRQDRGLGQRLAARASRSSGRTTTSPSTSAGRS